MPFHIGVLVTFRKIKEPLLTWSAGRAAAGSSYHVAFTCNFLTLALLIHVQS